jgi:hypothetical protein
MAPPYGPVSTVSCVSHVQPVLLNAPTAKASPCHGDQSQAPLPPGEHRAEATVCHMPPQHLLTAGVTDVRT